MDKREMVSVEEAREILDASPDLGAAVETGCGVLDNALTGGRQPFDLVIRAMDLLRDVERLARAVIALRAEHAAALDAARREGAEGMREVVKAEIRAAFHYNDPPADGVERPIGPIPGQWEAHQTLRKLLSRVCAVLTDGGAS